eukprot:Sdes_comp9439_c0_seq1m904
MGREKGYQFQEKLFSEYFEMGTDINDTTQLVRIASEFGFHSVNLSSYLEAETSHCLIREQALKWQQKFDIQGVPYFIMEAVGGEKPQTITFSGAYPSSYFVDCFKKLLSL